jgi:hypothetical protein
MFIFGFFFGCLVGKAYNSARNLGKFGGKHGKIPVPVRYITFVIREPSVSDSGLADHFFSNVPII